MQREFELLHCWDQRWATATVVYRISYISHVFKGIAKYYTEKYCNILQISHVLGYIETATEKMQLLKGGWDDQCFEDIVWNYLALLPEDWSLIVVCKEYGPDHRKRLIQTVFWSIAAKVALPYLDQDQTMFCPATTLVRQIWESFWDQCIIGSHHLLCSDPKKASRGREGAKKSSCNKHPSEG